MGNSKVDCSFCGSLIADIHAVDVVVCPRCDVPYHAECWDDNGDKCGVYACGAVLPVFVKRPLRTAEEIMIEMLEKREITLADIPSVELIPGIGVVPAVVVTQRDVSIARKIQMTSGVVFVVGLVLSAFIGLTEYTVCIMGMSLLVGLSSLTHYPIPSHF